MERKYPVPKRIQEAKAVYRDPGSHELVRANPKEAIQELLQGMLDATGKTQQDVSRKLKVTPIIVSQQIRGDKEANVTTLARWATACGLELELSFRRRPKRSQAS
jgi:hypothetical protein